MAGALMLALQGVAHAADVDADLILHGGPIVTVNDLQPSAEAVAVRGGRITAVGFRDEVMKLKGPNTRVVDLGGKTLIPGLIDAHGHVFGVGIQALSANMLPAPDGEGNDIPALQRVLKEWAAKNEKATSKVGWIIGFGYDDSQLKELRHPTREDLDAVSTTLPVVIIHQSGHMGVMNSKGLELAGYSVPRRTRRAAPSDASPAPRSPRAWWKKRPSSARSARSLAASALQKVSRSSRQAPNSMRVTATQRLRKGAQRRASFPHWRRRASAAI
jgi:predicted amidohydrolase YtcJ